MYASEQKGNPILAKLGANEALTSTAGRRQHGGQGGALRHRRLGAVCARSRPTPRCGAVNAAHDSLTPLAGGMAMLNIALGEVVFGGVGVGIMGLLVIRHSGGLHRRPHGRPHSGVPRQEDRGPRDEARDVRRALACCVTALGFAALAARGARRQGRRLNAGPHGLSEILYAFVSQTGNNGSAFAGLTASGRVLEHDRRSVHDVGPLLLHHPAAWRWPARWPARRPCRPRRARSPPTGGIFVVLLVGVILIVGALTYLPGPGARADRRALPHVRRQALRVDRHG